MQLDWERSGYFSKAVKITTIDAHAAGEPLRIVTGGLPEIEGATILERRRFLRENLDWVRQALMWEPRGHYNMYGCILTPPVTPSAHFGVLFLHNEGYSTMCGHGVIALVTTLIETGAVEPTGDQTRINLDTPAGLVRATAHLDGSGKVKRVSFVNVPSFVYAPEVEIELPEIGAIAVDVVYGGAFYAILPAERVGLEVVPAQTAELVAVAEAIKRSVNEQLQIKHPQEADLGFLYGTILTGPPEDPAHHSRNICVFANAEVDRSPTGTGVSARLALLYSQGDIEPSQPVVIESILGAGSTFGGRTVGHVRVGEFDAVIPEVSGSGFISGRHEFSIDPRDGIGKGFLLPY